MSKARTLADKATNGRKNFIINGGFDIWQRGIGFEDPSSGSYIADRWYISGAGGGAREGTYGRRDFVLGQTEVPGNPKHYIRNNRLTSGLALGDSIVFGQKIEGVQTLAGEIATLTCWMRTEDGTGPKTLHVELAQNFGTGGTPSANLTISLGTVDVTEVWQKFVFTFTVPSVAGKSIGTNGNDYLQIGFLERGTYTNFVVALAQVQLEKGSVPTDFEQRSVGEELLSCYRYFRKISQSNNGLGTAGYMYADNGKKLLACESYPVPMRASPTYTVTVAPTYENCSSLEITGDDKGMIIRVVVASTGSFRAHSWALELDSEL